MPTVIYRGNEANSFKEFRSLKAAERTAGINQRIPLSDIPAPFRYAAINSEELRDYFEYLSLGGAEIPEEKQEILSRTR